MFGDGRTLYHPLYIDNLLDAFEIAMREDRGNGAAYLIADEGYLSIEDLVRAVARAMATSVRILHLPVWPVVAAGHVVEKALCAARYRAADSSAAGGLVPADPSLQHRQGAARARLRSDGVA